MNQSPPSITSHEQLLKILKTGFAGLSTQFQLAARYLIDNPVEVALSSMRTIAGNAGVQASTLVRLAQHLGFQGWPEFKQLFVKRLNDAPHGYAKKATGIARRGGAGLVPDLFKAQHDNLLSTEQNNGDALKVVAAMIEKGQAVHIAGFRASFSMAFSLQYLYRFFRNTVYLIGAFGAPLEMGLRAIVKEDTVVVISFAPYSQEAIATAKAAREIGSKLVAITDSAISPVARLADASIVIGVDSPSFFPSTVAGIATIESLVALLVSRGGATVVKRIEQAERKLFETGAYIPI